MSEGSVTTEGSRLISRWLSARDGVERAQSNLTSAECEESNAQTALAKWLMPEDMKPGEKIGVWFGDSLIQVEMVPREWHGDGETVVRHEPKVTIRTRGKEFHRLAAVR